MSLRTVWLLGPAVLALALGGCAKGSSTLSAECARPEDCPGTEVCAAGACVPAPDMAMRDEGLHLDEGVVDVGVVDAGLDAAAVDVAVDAAVDAALDCSPGMVRDCGQNVGQCRAGRQICDGEGAWGACEGEVAPATEVCNGADDDCNGTVDDGYRVGAACTALGACGDGVLECASPVATRCSTEPGGSQDESRPEACNLVDDDCDGRVDDGTEVGTPCAGTCGEGAMECRVVGGAVCSTSEGGSAVEQLGRPCQGVGACGEGVWTCDALGGFRCSTEPGGGASEATDEICDGVDNDCDGEVDNGLRVGEACPALGVCGAGVLECDEAGGVACDTRPGQSQDASSEALCNGLDDDCDGVVDQPFELGAGCVAEGACGPGIWECDGDGGRRCSTEPGGTRDASSLELCNGLDDDCDGAVDEGAACGGDTCDSAPELNLGVSVTGDTSEMANDYEATTCMGTNFGFDQVFRFDASVETYAVGVAPTSPNYAPMFWIGSGCVDGALNQCVGGGSQNVLGEPLARVINFGRADQYFMVVDAWDPLHGGPFVATVTPIDDGDRCGDAIALGTDAQFVGTTNRSNTVATATCHGGLETAGGDQFFRLDLDAPTRVAISLRAAATPLALSVVENCNAIDLTCLAGVEVPDGEARTLEVDLPAGTTYVVVDALRDVARPAFFLEVHPAP